MTNPFARFVHSGPLTSISSDPAIQLASNCIRDFFGPTVQTVADCLQMRGDESTLGQIISTINIKSRLKQRTKERLHILRSSQLRPSNSRELSSSAIRASLLTLIQHSIVMVRNKGESKSRGKTHHDVYLYRIDMQRARLFIRYPRFLEYTKKALNEVAASLIEELLVQGRMSTVQCVISTVEQIQERSEREETVTPGNNRYTCRQAVLESFRRLVGGGYIEKVEIIVDEVTRERQEREAEFEIEPQPKKLKLEDGGKTAGVATTSNATTDTSIGTAGTDDGAKHPADEDPAIVALLQSGPYKILDRNAAWRVNVRMFHDSLRAMSLGLLVTQRFNHRLQSAGSLVTAPLKLAAHRLHADHEVDFEARTTFKIADMKRYMPKAVLQAYDKKAGGSMVNIYHALVKLSQMTQPRVLDQFEVADGRPEDAKFQVSTSRLVQYLQDRIIHQLVYDRFGEVAARIVVILMQAGHLESDAIAQAATVPSKDTREILHKLYRANYITLFNINQAKQHNPSTMFYLWTIDRQRTARAVTDNVLTCLHNMRLRRQHEVEVGKEWIERAKEADEGDENDNETDKMNYMKFCQGLERLDKAILQLDETLMVLRDY